jgi:hypothetical protein
LKEATMQKHTTTKRKRDKVAPIAHTPIRLVHIPNAMDADGEPRVALEVLPRPGSVSRRPMLMMFASIAAALDSKRTMEGQR